MVGVRVIVAVPVAVFVAVGAASVGGRLTSWTRRKSSTTPLLRVVSRSTGHTLLMSGLISGWV
jgi:hypothetical protein